MKRKTTKKSRPARAAGRSDLIFEIGCEEIPARMLERAESDLLSTVTGLLEEAGLEHGEGRGYSTPRRLAAFVPSVQAQQEDREETLSGPPVKAAFDDAGKPTRAALAFAQKAGVAVERLDRVSRPKGEYLSASRVVAGRTAAEILADGLPSRITAMKFSKTMRWADGSRRFVRPVHRVLAMLGSKIVPLEILGVSSRRETTGHPALGKKRVRIKASSDYEEILRAEHVIADRAERRRLLGERLREECAGIGVRLVEDSALLEEVADLVEYPGAVIGRFPAEFLDLPREILVTSLRHHQKAFSTETDSGLADSFLSVADRVEDPNGYIRSGNEWVVTGRLEDARFFCEEDARTPLTAAFDQLRAVTFHARAGSYAYKSERVAKIALHLAGRIASRGGPEASAQALQLSARLCKCDLTGALVGEFPELQGIAGGITMERENREKPGTHPEGAARAVYEHYRPAGARDALPSTLEGKILALADRLDSLAVLARAEGLPTGSRDPFGLRRSANGTIRLVVETPLPLSLPDLLEQALALAENAGEAGKKSASKEDLQRFLLERLSTWLKDRGHSYDTIRAAMGPGGRRGGTETLPRLVEMGNAIDRVRDLPDIAALIEIQKRCRNILDQAAKLADPGARLDTSERRDPKEADAEAALVGEVARASREVERHIEESRFEESLRQLVQVRPALSGFFDHVLVMHPEPDTRRRRLGLVEQVEAMIGHVADLTEIAISREEMQERLGRLAGAPPA